jgi:hypothetical protein
MVGMSVTTIPISKYALAARDIDDVRCCPDPKPAVFVSEGIFGKEEIRCQSCLQTLEVRREIFLAPLKS